MGDVGADRLLALDNPFAKRFIWGLPITDIPAPYVVFKPLTEVDVDTCQVVIFLADPDQLSALVIMVN